MKKVLIIIPAYNEEANILNTYNSIIKDNTENILKDNKIPHIKLINNLGIGGAVQTGYKYAYDNNYDIAVQFDGDGQHDIKYVKNIIDPLIADECDMCIGSRFIKKDSKGFKSSFARRLGIGLISFVIKLKTSKKIFDTTSGFRAINSKVIKLFSSNYPVEYPEPISTVNVLTHGFRVKEEYVIMHERKGGNSSINSWKNVYYMINVILSILLTRKGGNNYDK